MEFQAFDTEWIVSVGLNQRGELVKIERADFRFEKDVVSPVLQDITEISVALGKVGRFEIEKVVVAFEIPVFAGIDVVADLLVFVSMTRAPPRRRLSEINSV